MKQKLQSAQGETLVEVLASILICALSVALLFGAVMASSRIDQTAQVTDERYYKALTKAERQSRSLSGPAAETDAYTPSSGMPLTVTVANSAAPGGAAGETALASGDSLYFYGTKDLLSYAIDPPPPETGGEAGGGA